MFKDYEEFDIFDSTYFIVKNRNGLYNLTDRNGNLISDIWFEEITKDKNAGIKAVSKDRKDHEHTVTYSGVKDFEACAKVQSDMLDGAILPKGVEVVDLTPLTPYLIKTPDTRSSVTIIASVVVDGSKLLLGKDGKLYNGDGSRYVRKIMSDKLERGITNAPDKYRKQGIVNDWDVERVYDPHSEKENKITIHIDIDAFLYPLWEKHFDFYNTDWDGVEKYKSFSGENTIRKFNNALKQFGYRALPNLDRGRSPLYDEYKDNGVCYPFCVHPYDMCIYVGKIMSEYFDVEVIGQDDMEDTYEEDFKRNGYECSWGTVWKRGRFEPYSKERTRAGNVEFAVQYMDEENWKHLDGDVEVCINYYISDKELDRPDVDKRQEAFARKIVDTLFGRKYIEEIEKIF